MNADEVKALTLRNMLYSLGHKAAITEHCGYGCIGQADVFGINANNFTYEFEVKISRGDLRGELKAIELFKKIKY